MTKKKLIEYKQLKEEIKQLKEEIKELNQREACYSNDVVKGSSKGFPYTQHPIKIYGFDVEYDEKIKNSIKRKRRKLTQKILEYEERTEKVLNFINSQEESRTRQALTYIYIDGLSQEKAGNKMYIDRSSVSKTISKCLDE